MRKSMRKANQALENAKNYIANAEVEYKEKLKQEEECFLLEQKRKLDRQRLLERQRQLELKDSSLKYKRKLQESLRQSSNCKSVSSPKYFPISVNSRYYDGQYIDSATYEKVEKGNFKIILKIGGQNVELPKRFKSSTKAQEWLTSHGL